MYLLYVDHSGEPANADEKYFVMGGAAVFERQAFFLEQRLDEVQHSHLPQETSTVEFHVSAIRKHDKPPWEGMDAKDREKLITEVYGAIREAHNPGLCLFAVAIEKSALVTNYGVRMREILESKREAEREIGQVSGEARAAARTRLKESENRCAELTGKVVSRGLEGLCTQFEYFLRRFYDASHPENQQRGLMILDHASYEREAETFIRVFRTHGTGVSQVYNIIGPPFFADSASTRMLQIADFVSYAVFRRYEFHDSRYLDIIDSRFDQLGRVVHGLAHINTDSSTCMCCACLSRR